MPGTHHASHPLDKTDRAGDRSPELLYFSTNLRRHEILSWQISLLYAQIFPGFF
jgi:hypothetical protein